MFKLSAFSVDTGQQTTPPLVDGVVHNRLVPTAGRRFVRYGNALFIANKSA